MRTTTLLLTLLSAGAAPSVFAGTPFPQAGIPYFLAMQDFKKQTDALLDKKCLPNSTIKPFEKMLKKTAEVQQQAINETNSYMAAVAAPMPGSGKCDGGFEAVAAESEARRKRTQQSLASWTSMTMNLGGAMGDVLNSDDIKFILKDGDQSCADQAKEAFEKLKESASDTGKKMVGVVSSLQFEATRFENYTNQNKALQARCGQAEPGTVFQAVLPPDFSMPKAASVKGRSKNGKSDVTGIKEDLAKRKELEGADRSHFTQMQVHAQKLEAEVVAESPSQSSNSDITGDIISKLDGYAKLMEKSTGGANGALPMGAQQSAGAAIWDLPQNQAATQRLELTPQMAALEQSTAQPVKPEEGKIAKAETATGAAVSTEGGEISPGTDAESNARNPRTQATGEATQAGAVSAFNVAEGKISRAPASQLRQEGTIAGSEENLFKLVSERYKRTELFRKAKVLKVPLNSFDSKLQR